MLHICQYRFDVHIVLASSNVRFILQGITHKVTLGWIKKLLFKYYAIDPMHISLSISRTFDCGRKYDDSYTLSQHNFVPFKNFLIMSWKHPFWSFNTIYGINMNRICLTDTGKNDNTMKFGIDDENDDEGYKMSQIDIECNYKRFKYQYSVNPLRLDRAPIQKAVKISKCWESTLETLTLAKVKKLRCFVPKQILDPHLKENRYHTYDFALKSPFANHSIGKFTMFKKINPNAAFDEFGDNLIAVEDIVDNEDQRFVNDGKGDNTTSICLYSSSIHTSATEVYNDAKLGFSHMEFKVKLINPIGVTVGFTTALQILKDDNGSPNMKDGYKLEYRNDIKSNKEIYAINCENGTLFSHRRFDNSLFEKNLKFEENDTITIRLNLVNNHISIYKNDEWIGIAFEDIITINSDNNGGKDKDWRLVICMESNDSHIVVQDYYPTEKDMMKIVCPVEYNYL